LIDDIIGITSEEEKSGNFDVGELKGSRLKAYAETGKFENIVMVGDTDDDVQAGKIAGALTFFYSPNGNVHNWADHSISNLNQILKK
jgi:phosphoglycolate phosphatase-like HAD superfamily hydrolase